MTPRDINPTLAAEVEAATSSEAKATLLLVHALCALVAQVTELNATLKEAMIPVSEVREFYPDLVDSQPTAPALTQNTAPALTQDQINIPEVDLAALEADLEAAVIARTPPTEPAPDTEPEPKKVKVKAVG